MRERLFINKTFKPVAINTHPKEMDHRQTGKGKLLKLALQPPRGSAENSCCEQEKGSEDWSPCQRAERETQ